MSETRIVVVAPANPRARAASAARALARALERLGFRVAHASTTDAVEAVDEDVDGVIVAATRSIVLPIARRLKTRFQMPMLPIVALTAGPRQRPTSGSAHRRRRPRLRIAWKSWSAFGTPSARWRD